MASTSLSLALNSENMILFLHFIIINIAHRYMYPPSSTICNKCHHTYIDKL